MGREMIIRYLTSRLDCSCNYFSPAQSLDGPLKLWPERVDEYPRPGLDKRIYATNIA